MDGDECILMYIASVHQPSVASAVDDDHWPSMDIAYRNSFWDVSINRHCRNQQSWKGICRYPFQNILAIAYAINDVYGGVFQ